MAARLLVETVLMRLSVLRGLLLILGALPGALLAGSELETALAEARREGRPLLLAFAAPWCYSCYYMSQNVLNGEEWAATQQRVRVLTLDADAPEGHAVRTARAVGAIPSYLLLDGKGEELGRIVGEQTRPDFYARLDRLVAEGAPLQALERSVLEDAPAAAAAAAATVLAAHHARRHPEAGIGWWQTLPLSRRGLIADDPAVRHWRERLAFQQAAERGRAEACLDSGARVLSDAPLGCDRAYELPRYQRCAAALAPAERQRRLAAQRVPLETLLEAGLDGPGACADERSLVLAAVGLYRELGDEAAARHLLERLIAAHRAAIGEAWATERYRADNLRVYLETLGDSAGVEAVLAAQVPVFPEDYVYAFRLGRLRVSQGRYEAALAPLEQAAVQAYGLNRLRVAEQRVKALQGLGRDEEARRVAAAALRANGPWFAEDSAALRRLAGLPPRP